MSSGYGSTWDADQGRKAEPNLRWQKFLIPSDGFICLVDWMGSDDSIVQAARVSYGAGTKSVSDDRALIRHLMRNWHTTPFEQCELKFLVRAPMDVVRQWHRHRTWSYNEYSTRYSEAIDSCNHGNPWRLQSTTNKQGSEIFRSDGPVTTWPEDYCKMVTVGKDTNSVTKPHHTWVCEAWEIPDDPDAYLTERERRHLEVARDCYEERLKFGVAREQARKDLPLSNYTEFYAKVDLHNLFGFLRLRMDSHAQQEIRSYATAIGTILEKLFPLAWEAFVDYRLEAMTLSRHEIIAIKTGDIRGLGKREIDELLVKCERLGIDSSWV